MKTIISLLMICLLGACGSQPALNTLKTDESASLEFKTVTCGDNWFSADAHIVNQFAQIELSGDSGPSRFPITAEVSLDTTTTRPTVYMNFNSGYLKIRPYYKIYATGYWKANSDMNEIDMNCTLQK